MRLLPFLVRPFQKKQLLIGKRLEGWWLIILSILQLVHFFEVKINLYNNGACNKCVKRLLGKDLERLQLTMHQAFWRHSNNCEKILRLQRGFVCKIL